MSDMTIEKLELEVSSSSTNAAQGIDALSASLSKLKNSVKGGVGLNSVANQIRNLNTALQTMDSGSADKIDKLANSLSKLSSLGNIKLSSSIGNQLKNIGNAATALNGADLSGIGKLATALQPLSGIQKASGLQNTITQLNKLPQVAQALNGVNWTQFTQQMTQLANSLTPLANNLNSVSTAFSRFPTNLRQVVSATNSLSQSNDKASKSYVNLWAKARMAYNAVRSGANMIASWINQANQYIEDLNLFTASMGEYAEEAQRYGEAVGEALGIDPGEWMRNQGVFNTIIKGFGLAGDRAYIMSKNLTQLGYDISSFYNISFENAMQKLQSGISGELEPLRRLGYDLSVARLQQEAYRLGIEKKVSAMTQAEKAELRYYAIMTQVTTAQGDMARTINAPANQLRVLQAQVTQCARALGNIFIPALNAVLPYAIALFKVLRLIANEIANFFGFELPEVDYSGLSAGSNAIGDLADNASDASDKLKDTTKQAKKLKNNLLGIDELNIIGNDDDNGSGSTADDLLGDLGLGGGLGIDLPQYDFLDGIISSKVDDIVKMIKDAIWEIMAILSTALLVIGAILVFSGVNIPLGLALMAVGAIGLVAVIAENWSGMSERLAKVLAICLGILGGFLLVLGAFLAFSGANVPLGIGLMIAGAVALGTAAVINWKFLEGKLTDILATLMGIIGGALLALGVILVFTGAFVPLGIALIALGAAAIATAVALAWDEMPTKIKEIIADLAAVVGGALIALGLILALSGAATPLGIALIAAGAIAIVSAVALKWDSLNGTVKEKIAAIVSIVSGALIGIGLILALSGVATPLGIALMAVGAVGLATTATLNWNFLVDKIKEVIKEIGLGVGAALLALGVILAFSGVALPMGIALIAVGAATMAAAVKLNWDELPNETKKVVTKVLVIAGAASLAIGMILAFTGVALPLGIGLMLAGAAALGTAAALNWDELVNQLKEVVTKILIVAGAAALAIGIILVCTGVGIPLGIGLILAGAAALGTAAALNWDTITEKVGGVLDAIKGKFNSWKEKVTEKIDNVKEALSNVADKAKEGWDNVKEFWTKGEDGKNGLDNIVEISVELVKKGWTTVKGWIGKIPGVSQAVELAKKGWETVKGWVGNIPTLDQAIELVKKAWSTVKAWIGNIPTLSQAIQLIKSGWQTVKTWIGNIPTLDQAIALAKSGWISVKNWIGTLSAIEQAIKLTKSGWSSLSSWIGTASSVAISLTKSGWTSLSSWIGNSISVGVSLFKSGWSSIKSFFGLSSGGYDTGHGWKFLESGGYIQNGGRTRSWGIPMYANGGNIPSHGSMFVAGENGAEMVGHLNGQTEVLNQSQIKLAMRSAVISGMAQFAPVLSAINSNLVACTNAVINSVLVGSQVLYNGIENLDTYDPSSTLAQSTYEDGLKAYQRGVNDENMYSSMRDFYREYVEPTLREIADDTRRQADKEEQTIVQVGNRVITDAVDVQKRANGYQFAT